MCTAQRRRRLPGMLNLLSPAQDYMGRSGLLASFSLILASEIGDKTFFIAGLLGMRVGRVLAFTGAARLTWCGGVVSLQKG